MQEAIDQFKKNIDYIRHLGAIYEALEGMTTEIIDLSDILRAELVMAVSALDHFIHEIVRLGMLEIYQNKRSATSKYLQFSISLNALQECLNSPMDITWFDNEIRNQHSWQSFQRADRISEAIRLVSEKNIWVEIATMLGEDPNNAKQELNLIIDRRNKIAHEADINPTSFGNKWPINKTTVENAITFIESISENIYKVLI